MDASINGRNFQQAPFDEKNDSKRIKEIAKEVEERSIETPGYRYGICYRCGRHNNGFARVLDGRFVCIQCIFEDEVDRRFKEAK